MKEFVSIDGVLWREYVPFSTIPLCTMRLLSTDHELLSRMASPPTAQSLADRPMPGPPLTRPPMPSRTPPVPPRHLTEDVLAQHEIDNPARGGGLVVPPSSNPTEIHTEWQYL